MSHRFSDNIFEIVFIIFRLFDLFLQITERQLISYQLITYQARQQLSFPSVRCGDLQVHAKRVCGSECEYVRRLVDT